jgi:co-chaperonin GroES (HSP10)
VKIRPLRGQVVIREVERRSSVIWTPAPGQRDVRTHRGIVIAMGPPARDKWGNEIAHGFKGGDEVSFQWEMNEEAHRREWPEDGKPACWVRQYAVDGVWEGPSAAATLPAPSLATEMVN